MGVEMHAPSAIAARDRLDLALIVSHRDVEADSPDGRFDLVIYNDVIEHMWEADHCLLDIRMRMAVRGHLVGSGPNVRYYRVLFDLITRRDRKCPDSGILDGTHQRFFSERSLRRQLLESTLKILKLRGVGSKLHAVARGFTTRVVRGLLLGAVLLGTLGSRLDVQYLQLGFCLRRKGVNARL